uniref:Glabrous enhancer-binding protein-like DBD domain-containing protein n=1 Tax=Fagus sylvatica TaxID=28930 RepID=A0A2N9IBA0_FAGSY
MVTFLDFEDDDTTDYSFKEEEDLESESSEFSAEAKPFYEYHYDDELGDYIAISSPSSAEAEYHPDYEEPDSPRHNTTKRSRNEDEDNMHNKNNNKKKTARVWSQDDEITLLQALYEYAQNKRADPVAAPADMDRFYNSFKNSFHRIEDEVDVEFSKGHGMDAFVKKCGLQLAQAAFKRKLMQFALESFQWSRDETRER